MLPGRVPGAVVGEPYNPTESTCVVYLPRFG